MSLHENIFIGPVILKLYLRADRAHERFRLKGPRSFLRHDSILLCAFSTLAEMILRRLGESNIWKMGLSVQNRSLHQLFFRRRNLLFYTQRPAIKLIPVISSF